MRFSSVSRVSAAVLMLISANVGAVWSDDACQWNIEEINCATTHTQSCKGCTGGQTADCSTPIKVYTGDTEIRLVHQTALGVGSHKLSGQNPVQHRCYQKYTCKELPVFYYDCGPIYGDCSYEDPLSICYKCVQDSAVSGSEGLYYVQQLVPCNTES